MLNIIIILILMLSSVIYYKLADKFNIIDKPNHRSSHTTPTIRGGGILFVIAMLCWFFVNNFSNPYFILGVLLIGTISFLDDILTLSTKMRLPIQFIAIGLMLYQTGLLEDSVFLYILIFIMSVGLINIFNFMDGINGITGLYSVVILLLYYCVNLNIKAVDQDLILYPIVSILIFGYYNFRKKAMMFAGDIGSICIAMLIFFVGTKLILVSNNIIILLSVVVYTADGLLTMIYRKFIGENLLEAHRHHIYQKLVDRTKLTHLQVSAIYALLQLLVGIIVIYALESSLTSQIMIIVIVSITFIITYIVSFKLLEKKK